MFKEFKEFAMRGNVVDMAVGIIIGAAFGQIINSLVQDILMPPIGKLLGHMDFSNLFIPLGDGNFATVAAAKAAGGVVAGCLRASCKPERLVTSARTPGC